MEGGAAGPAAGAEERTKKEGRGMVKRVAELLWSMFSGDYWNRRSLEEAVARVEALLEEHRSAELAAAWPDTKWGLFELARIHGIAEEVAAGTASGHEFLMRLEQVLSDRRRNYVSRAEYGSDIGRLGSFVADIQEMRRSSR